MIIGALDSWYSWWLDFWATNPGVFAIAVLFAVGISVYVQRLKRRAR